MPLPDDMYDEDVVYRLRLCMLVSDADPNWVAPGSKINPCDGCDALIWVNESQVIPDLPEGLVAKGVLSICKNCAAEVNERSTEGVGWAGEPPPDAIIEEVKQFFGLKDRGPSDPA